jgi:hypothetical protein
VRGDGVAIAPLSVGAQVKGVVLFVFSDSPSLSHAGAGNTRFIDAAESLKQGRRDAHADLIRDDRGVKGLGLSTVDEDEVGAVTHPPAGSKKEAQEGEDSEAEHAGD